MEIGSGHVDKKSKNRRRVQIGFAVNVVIAAFIHDSARGNEQVVEDGVAVGAVAQANADDARLDDGVVDDKIVMTRFPAARFITEMDATGAIDATIVTGDVVADYRTRDGSKAEGF